MRRRSALAAVALLLPLGSGCLGGGHEARAAPAVQVLPTSGLVDGAWHVRATGARPGDAVIMTVHSRDIRGVQWSSSATYRADGSGTVDTAVSSSRSGTYTGSHAEGLLWSMRPRSADDTGAYFWAGAAPELFTLSVRESGARPVSRTFFRRLLPHPVRTRTTSLHQAGFVGRYVVPDDGQARHPAVLLLGGSEGGLPSLLLSADLAGHGYATLGVAYYKYPGLPSELRRIPIDAFVRAAKWLRRQPEVRGKVDVIGLSRGTEAAQLLSVHDRDDVRSVVAAVPSNVALCSFPGCTGPAWTWHGRAVPTTYQVDDPAPTDHPGAVIPLERARVPVLLVCAGQDTVWTSCPYARAIVSRLQRHGDPRVAMSQCPAAGHSVGGLVPGEPFVGASAADQEARVAFWPRLMGFLASGVAPPSASAACQP